MVWASATRLEIGEARLRRDYGAIVRMGLSQVSPRRGEGAQSRPLGAKSSVDRVARLDEHRGSRSKRSSTLWLKLVATLSAAGMDCRNLSNYVILQFSILNLSSMIMYYHNILSPLSWRASRIKCRRCLEIRTALSIQASLIPPKYQPTPSLKVCHQRHRVHNRDNLFVKWPLPS